MTNKLKTRDDRMMVILTGIIVLWFLMVLGVLTGVAVSAYLSGYPLVTGGVAAFVALVVAIVVWVRSGKSE